MKVYIKELEGQNCVFESISGIIASVEVEVDCNEEYIDKTIEEREGIVNDIVNEIRKLNIGEKIERFGFNWKVEEMSKEEYFCLGEFEGW
ncbi:hypothetical protein [Senegalia massiliensis]|uniref:Uncharacterized protein n=1 Tax=Senegalia massiliensis TaxID=1720316 RepID=A0A845QZ38_9CLOT|nr:hypothetical protein [Senegalia massiliensis]NBI08217.1 hypothetical protein [Senegalia massiliensis]